MNTGEKIIWRSGQFSLPEALSADEAYDKLMRSITETDLLVSPAVVRFQVNYIIAASIVGLLILIGGLFVWKQLMMRDIIAGKGLHTDYRLPDGSMISLNADTRIFFNKGSFNNNRNVKMEGEAFFNIEKGSTFTITTELAEVSVLGTSFNIFARGNSIKVSCFSGKVLVTSGSQSVIVSSLEMVSLENNKLNLYRGENVYNSAAWRTGEFKFENTPINLVFDEIERQYNVNFVLPYIDDLFFTGTISNKNLVNALDIVCITMGLTYEIGSNSKILIKSKTE